MELITGENDKGRRLDRILRKALPEYPLPLIHRLLRQGLVLVNGKPAGAQERLEPGVTIDIPSLSGAQKSASSSALALPSPEVIWQGNGLIAVNKPSGLEVHGHNSLDTIVGAYLADKISVSLSFKSGPLHRLDKPTSGIVIFSTNIEGARLFSSLLKEHKVRKTYLAIVEGTVKNEEIWQDELVRDKEMKKTFISKNDAGGKAALTKITPLASKDKYSLIKAEIATGRTHQIRTQAASRGFPLAGDRKYGSRAREFAKSGFFLHAWKIEFLNVSIEAKAPKAFIKKTEELSLFQNLF